MEKLPLRPIAPYSQTKGRRSVANFRPPCRGSRVNEIAKIAGQLEFCPYPPQN